ncbi:MAG: hypothetical protein WD969_14610 [Paracoccaceae bacterium]
MRINFPGNTQRALIPESNSWIGGNVYPISGGVFEGDDGVYFAIVDTELDDDSLLVAAAITVAGIPTAFSGPISGTTEQLTQGVQDDLPFIGGLAAATIKGTAVRGDPQSGR